MIKKRFLYEEIKNYDLVGYSCTTPQAKNAINHCKIIKEVFPDKQTVIGELMQNIISANKILV